MSNEPGGILGIDSGIYEFLIRIYLLFYLIFYLIKIITILVNEKEEKNYTFLIIKLVILAIFIRFLLVEDDVTFVDTILNLFIWLLKQIKSKIIHIITPILQIGLILTKRKSLYFVPMLFHLFYTDIISSIVISAIKNS